LEDKEKLILEPAFLLMYYGGFLWTETYALPVAYKRWFIERIAKELNKGGAEGQPPTKALHQNTPDIRALQNKSRQQVPSRLRRF
jgi:hypothetical protein